MTNTPDTDCHTLAELFEKACLTYGNRQCIGTREFFREEDEPQPNGKVFKKVRQQKYAGLIGSCLILLIWHCLIQNILGDYEWKTYNQVFEEVKSLGRGLSATGLSPSQSVLIFAETRADWMVAAQACFRQNFPGLCIEF